MASTAAAAKPYIESYYPYHPSHALPAVFATLIGLSLLLHIYQNFRYHFWRVTFFMVYGGLIFASGWIVRTISTYDVSNRNLYIAQTCLILGGPPIYSAAEYNILGRLMHHLPMHTPLNPNRVFYFFVYLGAAVESLTAVGAVRLSSAGNDRSRLKSGMTYIAIAVVLQAVVELLFMTAVGLLHYRCVQANMLTLKVRTLCIMLYGTSTLILLRCIFRAIEAFDTLDVISSTSCTGSCGKILKHEWYLYVFEAAPMVLYTYWLNYVHPGRFLPRDKRVYLDFDKIERLGPGWIDRREKWKTFADMFNIRGKLNGQSEEEKYWLRPNEWEPVGRGTREMS